METRGGSENVPDRWLAHQSCPPEHAFHVDVNRDVDIPPVTEPVASLPEVSGSHMRLLLSNARKLIEPANHFAGGPAATRDVTGIALVLVNELLCRRLQPPRNFPDESLKRFLVTVLSSDGTLDL
jgi:hypothetical protein